MRQYSWFSCFVPTFRYLLYISLLSRRRFGGNLRHICLFSQFRNVAEELRKNPDPEDAHNDPKQDISNELNIGSNHLRKANYFEFDHFPGKRGGAVYEAGQDGYGVEAADVNALHDLGGQGADLDAKQRTDQHPHGQRVEDVSINRILPNSPETGGEDDLKNIGANCRHGGNTEYIYKHGKGYESAAGAHKRGKGTHNQAACRDDEPRNSLAARDEILIER